ncbi:MULTISPECIES: aminopeptidase P family protein [unclassified Pseudomonas]|uniref:aminopeptidase P family protein n=1 Tax=unclassified Pseudomonas TaxID=196821 RepID=UPI000BD91FCA|nr:MULTISPECIES: aminopeptidase P family protein [unclassified Pseudomonas]PVZ13479.1 Xaa-Pro aminopeptidase [Pseudomonas sp. URIL14HWK12:I12]PVZ23785.1 Xaa-Pro aminopeptidase [Pseudomonas sp. URIL14HWK12:I10]PVZ33576.1 Xaa-Pro aminopeptidase [Pseudomonas sp. URIL14HWK12:I11]SNZ12070.1 Xaa-Pro aminopeptidase [Pseudomonas sp. URIL14HWK12:I9]
MSATAVAQRLDRARQTLRALGGDALLVPSADPHLSEYLPAHWQARQWLSGFTGSVGTLVVTEAFAGLWIDSRYWEHAERELAGTGIETVKAGPGTPGPYEWLGTQLHPTATVVVDGAVLGLAASRQLDEQLQGRVLRTDIDIFDQLWEGRPALPSEPVVEHPADFVSEPVSQKLARVREAMATHRADHHFLASLDDIGWLFNLRGSDVPYNPVFLAYALIEPACATLFVGGGKLAPALVERLAAVGVQVRDYSQIDHALASIEPAGRLLIDPARVTLGVMQNVPASVVRIEAINPSTLFKACKQAADIAHVRNAMVQDGAALCEFFAWLEEALERGDEVTELSVDEQLTAARSRRPHYVSPSFATIAAFSANGALPHYRATTSAHARITGDGLLLIDSGAQYFGGTTDITRMVPVGQLSMEQMQDCTRVLKGTIALSRARFPEGIPSPMLDAIARAPLWADGVNYGHGTGHGVGYFMNVHEGPQVIAYQANPAPTTAMRAGMVTSIEPGTYRPGKWGVRIENLVVAVPSECPETFGAFLEFETLTLCPIDTRCLLPELLSLEERQWLDRYHALVRERLAPLLQGPAAQWLERRTKPLAAV